VREHAGRARTVAATRHRVLIGHPDEEPRPQPAVGGWHWVEWLCEYAGTLFQLFLGFGAVALFETPASPLYVRLGSPWLRLVVIGLCFGLLAAAVAVSPVGRRSGAHLNPAVTLGFWANGHTSPHDLAGYAVAQTLGALTAASGFSWFWGTWAHAVHG
jgi:aquaporin Z